MKMVDVCTVRVGHGRFYANRAHCSKPVTVLRDGKPYCTIHDPEYVQARRVENNRKWKEREAKQSQMYAKTDAFRAVADAAIKAVRDMNAHDPWYPVIQAVRKWESM